MIKKLKETGSPLTWDMPVFVSFLKGKLEFIENGETLQVPLSLLKKESGGIPFLLYSGT